MTDSYVALDLETTGIGAKKEKITEIGMVKVLDGQIVSTYHSLVNPRRPIPEEIVRLTGIDDSMVQDAPGMEEILGEILEFMEELPLLGHQIQFDYGFLAQAAVNQGIRLEKDGIDTLALCRALMPAGERKNLSSACRYFGIDQENAHRALSDALCAHRLYQKLKEQYQEEENGLFLAKKLRYKAKKERTASKRQKEYLQDLIKYHRINVTVQMEHMSGNEISRMTDKIIFTYGKIPRETRGKQSPDK